MRREAPFGYPEDFLKATHELSTGERDFHAGRLNRVAHDMFDVVEELPDAWPNREELMEHVQAIHKLLPDVEERW